MHVLFDCQTDIAAYQRVAHRLSEEIVSRIHPLEQHVVIPAEASITPRWASRPAVFLIEEGCLRVASANGPLLVYEEGDLVGVNSSELYPLTIETTSFAAVVSVFSTEHLHAQAAQSQQSMAVLNDYLCASSMLFLSLLAERLRLSTSLTPVLRVYHAGEVILAQGNSGNSVMTMVEGEAHVEVDGVQVGVVHKDEIFGAIAAITGSERSATVVAASDCLVMELEATQFQALLQTHPALVTRLICDMAKTIKSLNTQLVGQVVHTAQQL